MINEHGGKMPDAVGIPEEQLRKAARSAVCKINIDSDLRLAMTGTIRKFFAEHPDKFDPREYLKPARRPSRTWSPTRSWTCWAATTRRNQPHKKISRLRRAGGFFQLYALSRKHHIVIRSPPRANSRHRIFPVSRVRYGLLRPYWCMC